jgi:hypothetical protein
MVSSPRTVASAVVCSAVTSAPGVTDEMPIRPLIGEVIVVQFRLIRALSSAACLALTLARPARR